jgi:hypothetical protein
LDDDGLAYRSWSGQNGLGTRLLRLNSAHRLSPVNWLSQRLTGVCGGNHRRSPA